MNLTMPILIGAVLAGRLRPRKRALMPSKQSAVAQVARIDGCGRGRGVRVRAPRRRQ